MKKITLLTFLGIIFFLYIPTVLADQDKNLVNIYLFYSNTCPHCQEEQKLLQELEKNYDNIKIYKYEINNEENKELLQKATEKFQVNTTGVPFTMIGDKYFIGYSKENTKKEFIKTILYYSKYGYQDKVAELVSNKELPKKEIKENQPTVDEFIKNYGNYPLLIFSTNDLELEEINILTTMLSEINPFHIMILIILLKVVFKLKNNKDKYITLLIYTALYLFQNIFFLLNIITINKIILLLALNYFAYSILLYIVKNKKNHLIYSITAILSSISMYLKINFFHQYIDIWKEISELYMLGNLEYIFQILLKITISFLSVILLEYIIFIFYSKIMNFYKIIHRKN